MMVVLGRNEFPSQAIISAMRLSYDEASFSALWNPFAAKFCSELTRPAGPEILLPTCLEPEDTDTAETPAGESVSAVVTGTA